MKEQTSQEKTAWQLVSCGMLMHTKQCDKETFANKRITVDRMNFGVNGKPLWISPSPAVVINHSYLY